MEAQIFERARMWSGGRGGSGALDWKPDFTQAPAPRWQPVHDEAGNLRMDATEEGERAAVEVGGAFAGRSRSQWTADWRAQQRAEQHEQAVHFAKKRGGQDEEQQRAMIRSACL